MSGKALSEIITYQDKAMKKSIEIVFPDTKHRWCLWHIMTKFPGKLNKLNQYTSIMFALENIIYDSLEQTEFEECWVRQLRSISYTTMTG